MIKKIVIFLLIFVLNANFYKANGAEATTKIDSASLLIGMHLNMEIAFKADSALNVTWASIEDSLESFEIIDDSGIKRAETDSGYFERRHFTLTAFDSGKYVIPAFVFVFEKPGFDEPYVTRTNPQTVVFNTVEVDTSAAIKDIKAPLDAPLTWEDFLPYIIAVLVLGALIYGAIFFLRKRKVKVKEIPKYDPKIPPHIMAIESLKKLEAEKLWQKGDVKKYYIELTTIIRLYIERQFDIDALEMITSDIIGALREKDVSDEAVAKLHSMLSSADLVKFAKHSPESNENIRAMEISKEFVEITTPKIVENEDTDKTS